MPSSIPRPPYDPELAPILAAWPLPPILARESIGLIRETTAALFAAHVVLDGKQVSHVETVIPGPGGDITLSILRSTAETAAGNHGRPAIYFTHGGGMILGNRFLGMGELADLVVENDAVGISVEYRLAPEHPDPAPIEDCYAGLKWVGEHMSELGIDPAKLMISGVSAGGGLTAGLALLVRDRGGPALCGQLLQCPMLDDRNQSTSSKQYVIENVWCRESNKVGWAALLGDRFGGNDVNIYAAPGRATDLSGLPPAYIDVGSAETFRDEDVAYASLLWASGVQAELHVWPGAFHGSDSVAPAAALSAISIKMRASWVRRVLSSPKTR